MKHKIDVEDIHGNTVTLYWDSKNKSYLRELDSGQQVGMFSRKQVKTITQECPLSIWALKNLFPEFPARWYHNSFKMQLLIQAADPIINNSGFYLSHLKLIKAITRRDFKVMNVSLSELYGNGTTKYYSWGREEVSREVHHLLLNVTERYFKSLNLLHTSPHEWQITLEDLIVPHLVEKSLNKD